MLKKALPLIFFFFTLNLSAQDAKMPQWVARHNAGQIVLDNPAQYYFGVASSSASQEDADQQALKAFGQSIEINVQTLVEQHISEKQGKVKQLIVHASEISSDVSLKGISVTNRFFDASSHTWYSLVKYDKDTYYSILDEEISRSISRKETELQKQKEENRLKEQKNRETQRAKVENEKLKMKKIADKQKLRKEKELLVSKQREILEQKYPDLFEHGAHKLVTMRNAQSIPGTFVAGCKAGINKFELLDTEYRMRVSVLEFGLTGWFEESRWNMQEFDARVQFLKNTGRFNKLTLAFGVKAYYDDLREEDISDVSPVITPSLSGDLRLPLYNFLNISGYVDVTRMQAGIHFYPLLEQIQDRIGVVLEATQAFDDLAKTSFGDGFYIYPGLQFKTTDTVFVTFAYEDNQYLTFSLDFGF
ncbi:MAG: hypothetical protein J7K89_04765 [Candidatus Cloacimonetes bacterium]|nr:hypothetical protein [Candidatus Cloacimonadota bacterium]